jgi:phage baseplate assembly protein W
VTTRTSALLGRGWHLPVFPNAGGDRSLAMVEGHEKVRESIRIILETEPGERVMRPDFGCGLRQYLMKPNTVATRALIERTVDRALSRFEPRIELEQVSVTAGDDPSLVVIRIAYTHLRDRTPANLVFPFYLEA